MFEVEGKHNTAKVFAKDLEKSAIGQIKAVCDQEFAADSRIRVMPDAHAGMGCVVGMTMSITDKIVPNFVGVDIGCGMEVVNLGKIEPDFAHLDKVIRKLVPAGCDSREHPHKFTGLLDFGKMTCIRNMRDNKLNLSIGSLGGGNHFIEVAKEEGGEDYYLIIHSGSRYPGLQTAKYHQKVAGRTCRKDAPFALAYVTGKYFDDYVNDMKIMREYARLNRKAIADEILWGMDWEGGESFTTIHNYLDTEKMVLRKGAVSALKGEKLLIPFNMRDGSMICEGLGNEDWNCSAPHGAGRSFSRTDANARFTLEEFRKEMEGIYSTSIHQSTLDECPMAYKPKEDILEQIGETVKILKFLKPVYNFKAPA